MEAAVIFQVIVMWGHPEDVIALAAALFAILAMETRRWNLSAWLWGAAIVVQPLVVALFPLAFVRTPSAQRVRLCTLAVLPSAVLVGTPLIAEWGATSKVLLRQENFEYLDHATPWIALSPHLSSISVGAGPGRLIAVAGAICLAIMTARRTPSLQGFFWLCALALSLRCVFESVMVPFYLAPPLAMIVLTASFRQRWRWLLSAWIVAMVATVFAYSRLPEWSYWTPMVAVRRAADWRCGLARGSGCRVVETSEHGVGPTSEGAGLSRSGLRAGRLSRSAGLAGKTCAWIRVGGTPI